MNVIDLCVSRRDLIDEGLFDVGANFAERVSPGVDESFNSGFVSDEILVNSQV